MNVGNLEAQFGSCWVTLTIVKPKLLILWHKLRLDIVKAHLRLQNSLPAVDIKDLDDKWALVVVDLELNLGVGVHGRPAFRWPRLAVLVALVTDDMRVVGIVEIFGAKHRDVQDSHGALDEVSMSSLGLR